MTIDTTIPLIDLHRHLDGSIRLDTILDLGRKHNIPLPSFDKEEFRPYVQITEPQISVMAFISKFEWMIGVLADYEACRRVAYENVLDAKAEGIDYIELRFSPWFMAQPHKLDAAGIVEAVIDGVRAGAAETSVKVNLIGIISRHYGVETGQKELEALLGYRDDIVALDLAGDEANFPGELFVNHFNQARDVGWRVTVHAGEAAGAESVWQAIQGLGAERLGHATRIQEDEHLIEYIAENKVGVEANLTSNVQTSTVPDYISHPLSSWLDKGILATINTDDPGISNIDLPYEYEHAAPAAGLSAAQITQAQRNALAIAFLSDQEKADLVALKS